MKNVEVEIKLPITNPDDVIHYLNDNATQTKQSTQHDEYYTPAHRDFIVAPDNINEWFRLRIEGDEASINYKDWQPHEVAIKTHAIEYETRVDSAEQIHLILEALNFKKLIDVKKYRQSWTLDATEVSVDMVEGLGGFIELEFKGEAESVVEAHEQLQQVLSRLGAKTGELDRRGYPYLLLEQQGFLG